MMPRSVRLSPIEQLERRTLLSVELAADLNTDTFSSNPADFVTLGNQALFFASESGSGGALWRTDGTAAGTVKVKDGFTPAVIPELSAHPVVVGGKVFFQNVRNAKGELWTTDGTTEGTQLLAAVQPGFPIGLPPQTGYASFAGRVFFNATDSAGTELWSTDGTPQGTTRFLDVVPGATSGNVRGLTVAGGYLFFQATENGRASLYRTDGTPEGTVRLGQFAASDQAEIVQHGDKVFFAAGPAGESVHQLWESDGTVDGTRLVKDVSPGASGAVVSGLTIMGGNLYFSAGVTGARTLWRSDFTAGGTAPVLATPPTGFDPSVLVPAGGQLFFYASDPTAGRELWRSDGTAQGTYRVADIWPGSTSGVLRGLPASRPVATARGVYFYASDPVHGGELYFTDGGTGSQSTFLVKDINPGTSTSYDLSVGFQGLVLPDGRLLFRANDPSVGFEPYVSDATLAGTHPLVDLNNQTTASSNPGQIIDLNGIPLAVGTPPSALRDLTKNELQQAFFRIDPQGGPPTWLGEAAPRTDETFPVTGRGHGNSVTYKNELYFFGNVPGYSGGVILRSNGAAGGTEQFFAFPQAGPGYPTAPLPTLTVVGDYLYFAGPDPANNSLAALYRTDGTTQGTQKIPGVQGRVGNLIPGPDGRTLYFSVGTKLARLGAGDLAPHFFADVQRTVYELRFAGDRLVFSYDYEGYDLVGFSDGSSNALTFVNVSLTESLLPFKGKVYFGSGRALWVSDGTASGTHQVWAHGVEGTPVKDLNLRAVGDYLYFVNTDAEHGSELWRTDGSDNGATLFADVVPGPGGSDPTVNLNWIDEARSVAQWRGSVYFTAQTPGEGAELWRADAETGLGLQRVADLYPGATGSDPTSLTVVGDRLYFIATRPDVGREVFKVVDDVAPRVVDASFRPSSTHRGVVQLRLSEAVALDTGAHPILINRADSSTPATPPSFQTSYDGATHTLTLTSTSDWPDGDYRLTIPAASLTDASGNPLADDFTFDFFVLPGDANRDRVVDFHDLVVLAQNYNSTGGKTWADGDFTGDGNVDFYDLVVLSQRYNTGLPAPAPAPAPPTVTAVPAAPATSVFSTSPVARPRPVVAKTPRASAPHSTPSPAQPFTLRRSAQQNAPGSRPRASIRRII